MKNSTLILLLCILLSSFASPARDKQHNYHYQKSTSLASGVVQTNFQNSFTPFYSENFAGGLPAGWQAIDSSGTGHGFNWHYTTSGYAFGPDSLNPAGTSAANGYMIYDSDTIGPDNADLISDTIDCSGHPSVHLNFNEFLTYYNESSTVMVSNDGSTWTTFHNSSAGLMMYESTPNPNNVDIDISSVAANQATVYIRFNYIANYSFFWMIDDVKLYEAPAIDGSLIKFADPVTTCSILSATQAVVIKIFNSGGDTINGGFNATFIADGGAPVTENVPASIAVGANLIYTFTGTANLSTPGQHTLTAYISVPGDTISSNDTITTTIFTGPHIVNTSNSYSIGFEPSEDLSGFTTGDSNADSITWAITSVGPHTGTKCAEISAVAADDWLFTTCIDLDSTIIYKISYWYRTLSTATQANFQIMMGNFQSAGGMTEEIVPYTLINNFLYQYVSHGFTSLTSGTYYIGFHVTNADSLIGFRFDDINISPDSGTGISTINQLPVSVFPNPSSGIIYLNSRQNSAAGFTIDVMSPFGQLITSTKINALVNYEINLNEQPAGIYLVRVISENGISTNKISVIH